MTARTLYYGMERFLYRLSKTDFVHSFILKGGLIFTVWDIPLRRPTKDIDFLGIFDDHRDTIHEALEATFAVEFPEDGIEFDLATTVIEERKVDNDRFCIRADFQGRLGRAEIPIQIDIGFSDEITALVRKEKYPTLLSGMDAPILSGYQPETVIAEKFHAMEKFTALPSRWKDYYDIWLISENFEFSSQSLYKAIAATFENRSTKIPIGRPACLTVDFALSHANGWKSFFKEKQP